MKGIKQVGNPPSHDADLMITGTGTYLQILARISPLPVANRLLVGLGATEMTRKGVS